MPLQPGVFNVTDSPWNLSPSNPPATNRASLQNMIKTLLDSGGPTSGNGGTIEFPSVGTFQFSGDPITIGIDLSGDTVPNAIIIQGDGQGSEAAPLLQKTDGGTFFVVNNDTAAIITSEASLFVIFRSNTAQAKLPASESTFWAARMYAFFVAFFKIARSRCTSRNPFRDR